MPKNPLIRLFSLLLPLAAASAAGQTCVYSFYQTGGDDEAQFRKFAENRTNQIAREKKGTVTILPWGSGALPKLEGGKARFRRTDLYLIYSGHGSIAAYYPDFVRRVREAYPDYASLTVEDTSCASMGDPRAVQKSLDAPAVRPKAKQTHTFWGNQMCTGPVSATRYEDSYFSWYGLRQGAGGGTEHLLAYCHDGNPCGADNTGDSFWCLDQNDRRQLYQCYRYTRYVGPVSWYTYGWEASDSPPRFPGDLARALGPADALARDAFLCSHCDGGRPATH